MNLNDARPASGAIRKPTRKGQGPGSGKGKTAGRGMNGQKSRSGATHRHGFEGGQMPLYRRLPKRGFHNPFRKEFSVVNLDRLQESFGEGESVTIDDFRDRGMIASNKDGLKILGGGKIEKRLVLQAHRVSKSARENIEAAGGSVELVPLRAPKPSPQEKNNAE